MDMKEEYQTGERFNLLELPVAIPRDARVAIA